MDKSTDRFFYKDKRCLSLYFFFLFFSSCANKVLRALYGSNGGSIKYPKVAQDIC